MTSARPNVILLVVDDLKPKSGIYGDRVQTPNIDHLMRSGLSFQNAHSSFAACAPSRISMLTGRRNDDIKIWGFQPQFRKRNPHKLTLPAVLRGAGYRTVSVGKIMDARVFSLQDSQKGPDECVPDLEVSCSWDKVMQPKYIRQHAQELCGNPLLRYPGLGSGSEQEKKSLLILPVGDDEEDLLLEPCLTSVAIAELRELRQSSQPFFLAVGWVLPHVPWVAPQRFFDLYTERFPKLDRESIQEFWQQQSSPLSRYPNSEILAYSDSTLWNSTSRANAYMASASFVDEQVGRLMTEVNGSSDNNDIIIFWSDHGFQLGEHGLWGKWTLFEQATKVPLSITLPSNLQNRFLPAPLQPGTVTQAPVDSIDIMPTILELCNVSLPSNQRLSGTSLLPLLRNPNSFVRAAAVSQMYNFNRLRGQSMGYALRTVRYRLIVYTHNYPFDKLGTLGREGDLPMLNIRFSDTELYDYELDGPEEKINRFQRPAYLPVQKQLFSLLRHVTDLHWNSLIGVKPFDLDDLVSTQTTASPSTQPLTVRQPTKSPSILPTQTPAVSPEAFQDKFQSMFGVDFILSQEHDINIQNVSIPGFLRDIGIDSGVWNAASRSMELSGSLTCTERSTGTMKASLSQKLWGEADNHMQVSCLNTTFLATIGIGINTTSTQAPTFADSPNQSFLSYLVPPLLVLAFILATVLCLTVSRSGKQRRVGGRNPEAVKEPVRVELVEEKKPNDGAVSEADVVEIDTTVSNA